MSIEIVTIDEEIKIIGLSFKKSGLPRAYENLGKMWNIFGEKHRGKIKNAIISLVDYGVCDCLLTDSHEYIAGCEVTEIGEVDESLTSFIVPAGKYIKHTSHKTEELFNDDIGAWAETKGIKLDGNFMIEIYPNGVFAGKDVEIYTLRPIQAE